MHAITTRIMLIAGILAVWASAAPAQDPSFRQIGAEDLKLLMDQKTSMTVVDARLPRPYKSGHSHDLRITTGLDLQQPTVFVAKEFELPKK